MAVATYKCIRLSWIDPFIEFTMAKAIRFFKLNTGATIPSVGLGTWQSEPGVVGDAVTNAIKVPV